MPKRVNSDYDIGKAFAAIEDELIASMIRNMKRHKVDEIKEGKQWSMWQTEQLKALEKYRKANRKKFGKQFSALNGQIEGLIRSARDEGEMSQEVAILNAIKKGFPATKMSAGATAEFFKLNDRKLDALIQATTHDMQCAETAVLRMADDQYRKIIFNAQVYANSGAGTYEKAVDMATKDFLSAGLNCIEYKNGARHTLSDYADMAIRTASKRAYLQGEGVKRQEWGISTVIMNKRGNPCPKCLPWVGKVLIDDVWSGGSRKSSKYPLMSSAIAAGLYHPRCRDSHTTYFEGISTPPDDTFTRKELAEIEKQAKREAREQYANRQADRFGRMARFSLDEDNQEQYRKKEEAWRGSFSKHPEDIELPKIIKHLLPQKLEEQTRRFRRSLLRINDDDINQLLRDSFDRVTFVRSDKKRSYFRRSEQKIYLAKSADESTIAHELFHEIDFTYGITESGMLQNEIAKDYENIQREMRKSGKSLPDMLYSKYPEMFDSSYAIPVMKEQYRGVSDIINGMTNGDVNLGYWHSKDYWKKDRALERESWAQCGRMYYLGNEENLGLLKEIFPNITEEFERIIKEMMK